VRRSLALTPALSLAHSRALTRPAATLSHPMGEGRGERENRWSGFGVADTPGHRQDSASAHHDEAGTAVEALELQGAAAELSLSPGERAGVRANIHWDPYE